MSLLQHHGRRDVDMSKPILGTYVPFKLDPADPTVRALKDRLGDMITSAENAKTAVERATNTAGKGSGEQITTSGPGRGFLKS
jgi:hypothetical protein